MISNDGIIIRIRAEDIRVMGRYATGVRLMRVQDDVKVVSFTRAERDEEAETEKVEEPSAEELEADMKAAAEAEASEVIVEEEIPDDEEE